MSADIPLPPKSPRVAFSSDDVKKKFEVIEEKKKSEHPEDAIEALKLKLNQVNSLNIEMFDLLDKRWEDIIERLDALECFAQEIIKNEEESSSRELEVKEVEIITPCNSLDDDPDERESEAFNKTFQDWHLHTIKENEKLCGQAPNEMRKYSTSEKNQFIASGWDDKKVNWVAYRDGRRLYWIAKIL